MAKRAISKKASAPKITVPKYPRHNLEKVLRIPKAILDQNAGKECSDKDTATFLGIKYNKGPYALELSSAIKFGLLERPSAGRIAVSDLAKKILRPQNEQEELIGLREAVLKAPEISTVYSHYRGENLPDIQFLDNALVDKFGIPKDKVAEFKAIFFDTLNTAKLIEEHNGKQRPLDVSGDVPVGSSGSTAVLKKLEKSVTISAGDSCFVMMPFAEIMEGLKGVGVRPRCRARSQLTRPGAPRCHGRKAGVAKTKRGRDMCGKHALAARRTSQRTMPSRQRRQSNKRTTRGSTRV